MRSGLTVQTHSGAKESHTHSAQPFFLDRPSRAGAFFAPMVQAKCASCEHDHKLQHQEKEEEELSGAPMPVQAKCACNDEGVKLQPKLAIGKPGDRFEQEADSMANAVMRTSEPVALASGPRTEVQRMPITPVSASFLQRDAAESGNLKDEAVEEGEEEKAVSPKREAGDVSPPPNLESRLDASRGAGSSLPASTRGFMESRFGHDFSGVRVHTGASSEQLNRDVRSLAFTSGSDLYFGSGQYSPDTSSGQHLLAHELTHVVQQTAAGGVARGPLVQRAPCLTTSQCAVAQQGTAQETHTRVGQEEQSKREEISQRTVAQARSAVNGNRAVEAEKRLTKELPNLRSLIHGVFIDEGAVATHVGARITDCEAWANSTVLDDERKRQFMGAKNRCVFITQEYEGEVRKYNGGSDKPDGRDTREGWLVGFRRRFTHEATHERFVENQNAGLKGEVDFRQSQNADEPDCGLSFSVNSAGRAIAPMGLGEEVSELAAEISEYTVLSRAADLQSGPRLNRWFSEKLTPQGESIPGTIRAIRCACSCAHADEYIRGAFKLATKGWTEAEKIEFHRKMFELKDEHDLYWPFELPPRKGEVGRHGFSVGLGGNIAGTDRLLSAMLTYRFVLEQWASGRLRLTTGAQVVGRAHLDFEKITGGEEHFEAGGLLGFQYIPEAKATEKTFGGFTARAEGGLGYGQFLLKPALPGGPAETVGSGDYILQVGAGVQFYLKGLTDLRPASLELALRMAKPMNDDAKTVHTLGLNFTIHR